MEDVLVEEVVSKCYNGYDKIFAHHSESLKCTMRFAIFFPPKPCERPIPAIYFLSDMTHDFQMAAKELDAQRICAQYGIAIVFPDTSPRETSIDHLSKPPAVGNGASFYVDATDEDWSLHYKMFTYITEELPSLLETHLELSPKKSVMGLGMGGHGAMLCALKLQRKYESVSAYAPFCNPSVSTIAQEAFTAYFGDERSSWHQWDALHLVQSYVGPELPILIDQGSKDIYFRENQLQPHALVRAGATNDSISVILRVQEGYDHSYNFVKTFLDDHITFHANTLNPSVNNNEDDDTNSGL
eukprot:gene6826-392_t